MVTKVKKRAIMLVLVTYMAMKLIFNVDCLVSNLKQLPKQIELLQNKTSLADGKTGCIANKNVALSDLRFINLQWCLLSDSGLSMYLPKITPVAS